MRGGLRLHVDRFDFYVRRNSYGVFYVEVRSEYTADWDLYSLETAPRYCIDSINLLLRQYKTLKPSNEGVLDVREYTKFF